jgi:hypothetical protein
MTIKYAMLKKNHFASDVYDADNIYTIHCEQTAEFGFWNDIVNLSSEVENSSAQKQELISI